MSRRIFAEDPDWFLVTVPSLSTLCLHSIVRTFEEKPTYEELTPIQKDFVTERLSTILPLHLTANLICDGVYWKRRCEHQWGLCDVSDYGHSWKRMFFERHMENIIELFIPDETEPSTVLELVPLCKNYVKRLDISQLLPPIKEPQKEEEEWGPGRESDDEYDGPSMDHFDFNILLHELPHLEELHLAYRVKQCGMNFEWSMFEMTERDCESLGKALKSCETLKLLGISLSHIDDKRCCILVRYLLDHPSLSELDFSHNIIGDRGAKAISELLTRSKLETLNMGDNNIGGPGAEALARALSKNSTLLSLNLRINRVPDDGGEAIGKALLNNSTLRHLHLGANVMTRPTAIVFSKVLTQNKTLKSINLYGNNLGVDGGRALEEAMSHNTSVTECNLRLTEADEQSVSSVDRVVGTNKRSEKERRAEESQTQ